MSPGPRLAGLGTATPDNAMAQPEAARRARAYVGDSRAAQRLLATAYRKSGVDERGMSLLQADGSIPFLPEPVDPDDRGPGVGERMHRYQQLAPTLGLAACRKALDDADGGPGEVDQLVTVSCTGFSAPGLDLALADALELPRDCGRTHVGFMGCHGALNGLRVAGALAAAGSTTLLCAVELCTLHFQYGWHPEEVVANALFADGAAATLLRPGGGTGLRLVDHLSLRLPDSAEAMTWRIDDHGFRMTLSPRVPDLIEASLREVMERWLDRNGLSVNEVGSWAVHPGGPRIVDAVEVALGLPAESTEASREVLADHGNMSSPTVLFILDRLRRRERPGPVVAVAFGPGLAVEAALLR